MLVCAQAAWVASGPSPCCSSRSSSPCICSSGTCTLAMLLALLVTRQELPRRGRPSRPYRQGLRWLAALALAAVLLADRLGRMGQQQLRGASPARPSRLVSMAAPRNWISTSAFTLLRELGETRDGQPLPGEALITIHWLHRLGAPGCHRTHHRPRLGDS
ncbi:MAG: hypothetical protein MZW92_08105 [Comamonadaceae bacterium]|nr:hypothetical protein [Comamonadaceae bacterium]